MTTATAAIATTATLTDYTQLCKDLRATTAADACTGCGATDCALYGYGGSQCCLGCL